jgi:hypothetical protein
MPPAARFFVKKRGKKLFIHGQPGLQHFSHSATSMSFYVTIQFWKNYHAVHVSFARTVSFGHLPEAHSIMNCILPPKTE